MAPRFAMRLLWVVCVCSWCLSVSAHAAIEPILADRGTVIEFPERLTFRARIENSSQIERVLLEYGVEQRTCGEVTALAFPEASSSAPEDYTWTWDMRQSGSLPPGATVWYRWRVIDKAGNQQESALQRVSWLDESRAWKTSKKGNLALHWYEGSPQFAQDLLDTAVQALERLGRDTGVTPQSEIHIYIYGSTEDMRKDILYQPGWTGGLAFSSHSIVTIGISPDQIEWGKRTIAHELTHVLVGQLSFSCLGSVPTWLNEGIAVYGEGGPDQTSLVRLNAAINEDTLMPVRVLSGNFSEDPVRADLSYAESFSLVEYLVTTFGREKLLDVFAHLREGIPIEDALQQVYGFGIDGLEDRWRTHVGAPPRRETGIQPTATMIPTPVPTYRPISGMASIVATDTPLASPMPPILTPLATTIPPTSQAPRVVDAPAQSDWPVALVIGALGLVVMVSAAVLVLRIRRRAS